MSGVGLGAWGLLEAFGKLGKSAEIPGRSSGRTGQNPSGERVSVPGICVIFLPQKSALVTQLG